MREVEDSRLVSRPRPARVRLARAAMLGGGFRSPAERAESLGDDLVRGLS